MRVLITGASGFIGTRLTRSLAADGHSIAAVGRAQVAPAKLEGTDAVIHLAGEPVAQRWTRMAKQRILASRVEGTRRLVEVLTSLDRKPPVLICASAVGIYGSRGDEVLTEQSKAGEGFLSEVCLEWEQAAVAAEKLGIRVVRLRLGVVLGRDGGALAKMLLPFRIGLGGRLGSGRQWMSWIHLDDVIGLIHHAINLPNLRGPVNATAPTPVTNAEFTGELSAALRRPAVLPVPALALRLLYGEMSGILLGGQRVLPAAAESAGFQFRYPHLRAALGDLLR